MPLTRVFPHWAVGAGVCLTPALPHPQIFLKVAEDTALDADTTGKTPQSWLELNSGVHTVGLGRCSAAQSRGVGCPQHPVCPCHCWGLCWEHLWMQRGITACGLGPALTSCSHFVRHHERSSPWRDGRWGCG